MEENLRDYKNYGGGVIRYRNPVTGRVETIFVCPYEIDLSEQHLTVRFRGWLETDSFAAHTSENRTDLPHWFRNFSISGDEFQQLKEASPEFFAVIRKSEISFQGLDGELDFHPENFSPVSTYINSLDFTIRGTVKSVNGKTSITKTIDTREGFERAKQDYIELVGLLITFAWQIAKQRDKELAEFEILQ